MNKLVDSFYLKRTTFIVAFVLACISWIFLGVDQFLAGENIWGVYSVLFAILLGLLFWSYKRGETNLQKMLLGGLLVSLLAVCFEQLARYVSNGTVSGMVYFGSCVILILIIIVAHMMQQSDHTGASSSAVVGQCSGLLNIALLVWDIYLAVTGQFGITELLWTVCIAATVVFIVSMETRIKEYKKIRAEKRAAHCWTEEERQKAKLLFKL